MRTQLRNFMIKFWIKNKLFRNESQRKSFQFSVNEENSIKVSSFTREGKVCAMICVTWSLRLTWGMDSVRLEKLDDLEGVVESLGSGLPQSDEAQDEPVENVVDERREIESDRFLKGEMWTCFSICNWRWFAFVIELVADTCNYCKCSITVLERLEKTFKTEAKFKVKLGNLSNRINYACAQKHCVCSMSITCRLKGYANSLEAFEMSIKQPRNFSLHTQNFVKSWKIHS